MHQFRCFALLAIIFFNVVTKRNLEKMDPLMLSCPALKVMQWSGKNYTLVFQGILFMDPFALHNWISPPIFVGFNRNTKFTKIRCVKASGDLKSIEGVIVNGKIEAMVVITMTILGQSSLQYVGFILLFTSLISIEVFFK